MTDIKGSPQVGYLARAAKLPPETEPRIVVSATVNADDKLPESKPEGEHIIKGSPQTGYLARDAKLPPEMNSRRIVPGVVAERDDAPMLRREKNGDADG